MDNASRNRKRILIFSVIPLLASVPFFTDDFILRIISASILVIYSAFIIFLRDSSRSDEKFEAAFTENDDVPINSQTKMEPDDGEGFEIISPNKDIEIVPSHEFSPKMSQQALHGHNIFTPEVSNEYIKIATEKIPEGINSDEYFGFALEKILQVIKDSFNAHSALFFWFNPRTKKIALEKFASSSNAIIKQKFDLEDDILSKIILKKEPEILSEIMQNAETDNIRYYSTPQQIKSFVGVPLYYKKTLAGILAMDSKEHDFFGVETIYSMGRFVRVISLLISLFEEKHADSKADERLKALLDIVAIDKKFEDEKELFVTIENSVKHLIPWDIFTFVFYEPHEKQFKTSRIANNTSLKYIGENKVIDLSGTLVGRAILDGVAVKIDDTTNENLARFSRDEDISFGGTFLAIPLAYDGQIYGLFCFDSLKTGVYSNTDLTFIKRAIKIFSFMVYSFSTQKVLRSLLSVDIETKMLNKNSFIEAAQNDLLKAKSVNVPSTLALIKIDKFIDDESLFENNPFPKVLKSISGIIKEATMGKYILGRVAKDVFGIFFFNSSSQDVFLWAEKLRIKIARTSVAVSTKQTTYTISGGIASAHEDTENINELFETAQLALKKAIEKGGNTMKN
jgi:diguanylate cyclase (GGDEF)-like protein